MTETIGEAHKELRELQRSGLLKEHLEKLIENQEERLSIKYFGRPKLIVTMYVHEKPCYKNGKIILQYWDEEYLHHELGHFYLDKLCKRLGVDLGIKKKEITEWWEARNRFVSEGIATYFEREMNVNRDEFNDSEYPKNIEAFLRNNCNFLLKLYYSGGYHLVKPILDKFGIEGGCKKIVLNLPKKQEMVKLPNYREKILSEPELNLTLFM